MRYLATTLSAALLAAATFPASALIVDGSGNVTDWNITPFGQANAYSTINDNTLSTRANNYAPIDYPSGVGRNPSGGERFDLEEAHARIVGTQFQALIVASGGLAVDGFNRGDLFVNINGIELGIVTQSGNQGLAVGSIYQINSAADTVILNNQSGSYLNVNSLRDNDFGAPDEIRDIAGPWAVDGSINPLQLLGTAVISSTIFSYGGAENNTSLMEYTFDLADLGLSADLYDILLNQTWACGNDLIRLEGRLESVPAPAALPAGLALLGLVSLNRRRRLNRHAA